MNVQDFCWNWFAQSGQIGAYMGYARSEHLARAEEKPAEAARLEPFTGAF